MTAICRAASIVLIMAFLVAGLGATVRPVAVKTRNDARWARRVVNLSVSASLFDGSRVSGDGIMQALAESSEAWARATGIRFVWKRVPAGSAQEWSVSRDRINSISAGSSPESLILFSGEDSDRPAKTRLFISKQNEIVEADIVLNPFLRFSSDGLPGTFDLQSVITHELGHLVGMNHSPSMGSTMFEALVPNGRANGAAFLARSLSTDDLIAAGNLYGMFRDEDVGSVFGRVTSSGPKRLLSVWVEEESNARVVSAQTVRSGSTFVFKGLPPGSYVLRTDAPDAEGVDTAERRGGLRFSVTAGGESRFDLSVGFRDVRRSPHLLSVNGEGSASAMAVGAAGMFRTAVHLSSQSASGLRLGGTSSLFDFVNGFVSSPDGGGAWVGADLFLDGFVPAGDYTLVVTDEEGVETFLIGALSVDGSVAPVEAAIRE